ncbi:MAG: hypothetical protein GX216_03275 [Methanomicrobiales archaeon]|nr:hypothetical protein [Methanomicrobiales archaeon]
MQRGMYYWIILILALALIALAGAAEPGDYTTAWNRTYGGDDTGEAAYAIIADPEGAGFFFAGETGAFGAGETDAWVVRLTPEGDEVWNRTYGREGDDLARSIIQTDDGNLLVAGTFTFIIDETGTDTDAWVAEIDPAGSEIWNRTYGGPDVNASANAVIETDDGDYIFVGSIAPREEEVSWAWVVRLTPEGDEVWDRTFGGDGCSTANAATRLPDGDLIFAGSTDSSGAGKMDAWVVRLTPEGDEVWNRTFGSPDDDCARAVINTTDGNILIAGTFTERPDDGTVDTDALLMKLTPDGDILWNWIYGEYGVNESANSVIETADGSYIFAGEAGFSGTDDTDAWLVGTDAEGAVAWSRTFGGINPGDRAASILQPAGDEILFAGTFNATVQGGEVNTDAWVVRLRPALEPRPEPTTTPIKPPKAPPVPQKPVVTPTPCPTMTVKPTKTPGPWPTMTTKPTVTETTEPTEKPTAKPTRPTRPYPTTTTKPTVTETTEPTEKPTVKPTRPTRPYPTATTKPTVTETQEPDDQEKNESDGSLSGAVWYDLNVDGHRDPGEPGIPEICVLLIGKRSLHGHTVTDAGGSYRFPPSSGDFDHIEFLLPDGYSCTIPGPDNDVHSSDGIVAFADGGASRQVLNAGFTGDYQNGTPSATYGWVRGTTWSDNNQDGIRDETHGITDVEVRLRDADGAPVASARTRHHYIYESMYLFGPLPPGEYSLQFTAPEGYIFTGTGGDSHADPLTGTSDPFRIEGGDVIVRDAGVIPSPTPPETAQEPDPAGTETPGMPDDDTAGSEEDESDGEVADDDDAAAGTEAIDTGDVNETPAEPGGEDTAGTIDLFNKAPPGDPTAEVTDGAEPEMTAVASLLSRLFKL